MITWHDNHAGEHVARVSAGGICVARLRARADAWQIESLDGLTTGKATSVPGAKRSALEKLAEVLPKLQHEVDVALKQG